MSHSTCICCIVLTTVSMMVSYFVSEDWAIWNRFSFVCRNPRHYQTGQSGKFRASYHFWNNFYCTFNFEGRQLILLIIFLIILIKFTLYLPKMSIINCSLYYLYSICIQQTAFLLWLATANYMTLTTYLLQISVFFFWYHTSISISTQFCLRSMPSV